MEKESDQNKGTIKTLIIEKWDPSMAEIIKSPQPPDLHEKLWAVCKKLPEDYTPYGKQEREEGDLWYSDCSCGCKYYVPLEGKAGFDWGICRNPLSHRVGLLTFEHQGCKHFEYQEQEQVKGEDTTTTTQS